MAYLQLADNAENEVFSSLAENEIDNYIFIPTDQNGAGKWIREDYFDDLPQQEWDAVMDMLEPYQNPGVNGIFKNWKAKRTARKEARADRKLLKSESKATARLQRSSGGGFMDKVGGLVSNIFGKAPVDAGFDIQSGQAPQFYAKGVTKWYATTAGKIGIGAGVLVIGGIIYKLTTKK